jgi:hypothetical protein
MPPFSDFCAKNRWNITYLLHLEHGRVGDTDQTSLYHNPEYHNTNLGSCENLRSCNQFQSSYHWRLEAFPTVDWHFEVENFSRDVALSIFQWSHRDFIQRRTAACVGLTGLIFVAYADAPSVEYTVLPTYWTQVSRVQISFKVWTFISVVFWRWCPWSRILLNS